MIRPHRLQIEHLLKTALMEDMPHGGDITSALTIPEDTLATAHLNARSAGVIAGLEIALGAFTLCGDGFEITAHVRDGDMVKAGETLATIHGPARALLSAERTCLNIMSHLSGIASLTARYVSAVKGTSTRITCTRKTLPGLRVFQKYAVAMGGGFNHRSGLDDAVMIKDNHTDVANSIKDALTAAAKQLGHTKTIEIEVETLDHVREVLDHGGAHILMLDNMAPDMLKEAVKIVDGRLITEASGGITLETVQNVAKSGVDMISVGALTHSAAALDIGLDITIKN